MFLYLLWEKMCYYDTNRLKNAIRKYYIYHKNVNGKHSNMINKTEVNKMIMISPENAFLANSKEHVLKGNKTLLIREYGTTYSGNICSIICGQHVVDICFSLMLNVMTQDNYSFSFIISLD